MASSGQTRIWSINDTTKVITMPKGMFDDTQFPFKPDEELHISFEKEKIIIRRWTEKDEEKK